MASQLTDPGQQLSVKPPDYPPDSVPSGWSEPPQFEPKPKRCIVKTVRDGRGTRLLTTQELAFVDAMLTGAYGVPSAAAKYAKYADPATTGQALRRRLEPVIEQERKAREEARIGTIPELLGLMWDYARKGRVVGHSVAAKSQENLCRINGLLADKLDVRLDRAEIRQDITRVFREPSALLPALSAGEDEIETVPGQRG